MSTEDSDDATHDPFGHTAKARDILSDRLRLLADAWEFQHSDTVTFPLISAHLNPLGVSLSRPRWSYMINGTGPLVTDQKLLRALAAFFEVDENYLLDLTSEPPASLVAQLNFVQDMRELRVERFAARNLAGVAPETLNLITDAIRKSRENRAGSHDAP